MDYTDRSASEVTAACAALLRSMRDPDAAASALGGLAATIRRAPPDAADLALLPVSLFFDDQLAAKAAARPKERVLIAQGLSVGGGRPREQHLQRALVVGWSPDGRDLRLVYLFRRCWDAW